MLYILFITYVYAELGPILTICKIDKKYNYTLFSYNIYHPGYIYILYTKIFLRIASQNLCYIYILESNIYIYIYI